MADRYWVGGSGTWNSSSTANWSATSGGSSGASAPTSSDNVIFDNASDAGANYTVTIVNDVAGFPACANFTVSSQDFVLTMGTSSATDIYVHGSLSVNPVTAGRYNVSGTNNGFAFRGAGSYTISVSNASLLAEQRLVFESGTRTLSTNLTGGNNGATTVQSGATLDLNGFTFDATSLGFTLNFGGTLNFGTGGVLYTASSAAVTFTLSGTVSAANGHVWMNTTGAATLQCGAVTINQVTMGSATCDNITIIPTSSSATFNTLILGGTVAQSRTVIIDNNCTATTFNFNGASATTNPHNRRTLVRSGSTTQRTITSTTLQNVQCLDFENIAFSGVTLSGTSIGDLGNNSGITFTAAKTSYWVGGTGSWVADASTRWAASSGGAAAVTNFPIPQDTVVFDNSSGAASSVVTIDAVYPRYIRAGIGTFSASARTSALTLSAASAPAVTVGGNWTNGSGLTLSLGCGLYFNRNCTLTSSSVQFSSSFEIGRSGGTATLTLADTLSLTGSVSVVQGGTLALGSNTATVASYTQSSGGTFNSGTGTLVVTGTPFQVTSGSVIGTGTVRMSSASAKTFAGGGNTYGTLQNAGAGSLTVSGNNTFTTISNSVQPTTFNFTSGTTQTVTNFNVSGTAGNLVTITATSTGQATLSKASGALAADGNVNGGTNTGWIFSSGNGLFFGSNF